MYIRIIVDSTHWPQESSSSSGGNSEALNTDVDMMANTYVVQSKLHLVDLAGSERAKRTLATGVRLIVYKYNNPT